MADMERIPIIRLRNNLVVSIQVDLSDRLVVRLKEDITKAIEATSATGLILDLSGIDLMDSYISRAIRDIGLVARLMGVRSVMCGMSPLIATTLVEMGMDMKEVVSTLNLDSALALLEGTGGSDGTPSAKDHASTAGKEMVLDVPRAGKGTERILV